MFFKINLLYYKLKKINYLLFYNINTIIKYIHKPIITNTTINRQNEHIVFKYGTNTCQHSKR